jgi:cardiolipin synthase (CMP-forming)
VNWANRITLARVALIPVFIGLIVAYGPEREWCRYAAMALFLFMSTSDFIDGYIARHYHQQTKLGTILDPLADKLMVNITYIFLAVNHELAYTVPRWIPVVIMLRDVCILITSLVLHKYRGPIRPIPRLLGKITTVLYSCGIMAVLLEVSFAREFVWMTMVIACASWLDYAFYGHERVVDDPFIPPREDRKSSEVDNEKAAD